MVCGTLKVHGQASEKSDAIPVTLVNFMISISADQIIFNLASLPEANSSGNSAYEIIERLEYNECFSNETSAWSTTMSEPGTTSKFMFTREQNRFRLSILPNPAYRGCINISGTTGENNIQMVVMDMYGQPARCTTLCLNEGLHPYLTELLEKRLTTGDYLIQIYYSPSLEHAASSLNRSY